MTDRYNVVRISDDMVVNMILLDGPEPSTEEHRYVPAGAAGIGWIVPVAGDPVPPVVEIVAPVQTDLESMLAELDDLRARIASATEVVA